MARETPLDPPAAEDVRRAAATALDRRVADVTSFAEGLNAVYRIDHPGGGRSVLKAATFSTDRELLTEAALLDRLGRETPVPFPAVLAVRPAGPGPLPTAVVCTEFREGRTVTDLLSLSPSARERLVAESGCYLAAVHDCRVVDRFGRIRVAHGAYGAGQSAYGTHEAGRSDDVGGDRSRSGSGVDRGRHRPEFEVDPGHGDWGEWFPELVADVLDGLAGAGHTTDDDPRFSDLVPDVERALSDLAGTLDGAVPSVAFEDYRPANLVLAPAEGSGNGPSTTGSGPSTPGSGPPVSGDRRDRGRPDDGPIAAVLDVGSGPAVDGLLDLALAEDALVDVPLGGTDHADRLRRALRSAYLETRTDLAGDPFGTDRYAGYRLYARARHLGPFDYWRRFAREDDPDAVARRWRSFVADRLAELGGSGDSPR